MIRLLVSLVFMVIGLAANGQTQFSYDFETSSTLPKFTTFGTNYELFENPKESYLNSSLLVGKVQKVPGESISWSGIVTRTPSDLNLQQGGLLKMKVFATTNTGKVLVKLEDNFNSNRTYSSAFISKLNEWQELSFWFEKNNQVFSKMVITFDVGNVEPHIFYFDDLEWIEGDREAK